MSEHRKIQIELRMDQWRYLHWIAGVGVGHYAAMPKPTGISEAMIDQIAHDVDALGAAIMRQRRPEDDDD